MFECVRAGPQDPMYDLKVRADNDACANKADLGVGIYRNENGLYQELSCIKEAKVKLSENDPGHDYEVTTGNPRFLKHASKLMLGDNCSRLLSQHVASVQTISGTGAVHTAALLIACCFDSPPTVYVGVPAWGNYKPLCNLVGLEVVEYQYYNATKQTIDFESILKAIRGAPAKSIFILQGCCHNPTGADPTPSQWDEIALAMKERDHLPLFDVAYQGLGNGLDEDAYANFALYGERCGALHAVCSDAGTAVQVCDRLRCLIRWEFSSSPAFGSRLVNIVMDSEPLTEKWRRELDQMQQRLKALRQELYSLLTETYKTPGDWSHITRETGLFSYLRLTPNHCRMLVDQYHIYLPPNGRINVSGLNCSNIERVAAAIDTVVRSAQGLTLSLSAKLA